MPQDSQIVAKTGLEMARDFDLYLQEISGGVAHFIYPIRKTAEGDRRGRTSDNPSTITAGPLRAEGVNRVHLGTLCAAVEGSVTRGPGVGRCRATGSIICSVDPSMRVYDEDSRGVGFYPVIRAAATLIDTSIWAPSSEACTSYDAFTRRNPSWARGRMERCRADASLRLKDSVWSWQSRRADVDVANILETDCRRALMSPTAPEELPLLFDPRLDISLLAITGGNVGLTLEAEFSTPEGQACTLQVHIYLHTISVGVQSGGPAPIFPNYQRCISRLHYAHDVLGALWLGAGLPLPERIEHGIRHGWDVS